MRWLLVVAVLLAGALAASASLDPALPFLPATDGLRWWVDPQPLAVVGGGGGPHLLRYTFTPPRAGQLTIAAMREFRLTDGARLLAGSTPGRSWKRPLRVEVP